MTTGPVDSNAELKCGICDVTKDDNLIIICDLCDTASHTYCVGLGYTVPEGDWFCHDCAAAARETNANDGLDQQNVKLTAEPGVAILDNVRGTSSQVFRRPMASPIRQNNHPSSSIPLLNRVSRSEGKKPMSDVQRAKHKVQMLRENWNSLRSGKLRFNSKSFQSGGTSSQKEDSSSLSHGKLDDSHSMASKGCPQSTVQGAQSSNMLTNRGLEDDVRKAWKMWDKVKMTKQTPRRPSSIPQAVDNDPPCSDAREKSSAPRSFPELKNQQPRTLDFRHIRMEEQRDYSSVQKNLENHRSPILGEKRQSRVTCDEMLQHARNNTTHSEGYRECALPGKAHTSTHSAPCHGERNVAKEQRQSANLVTSVGSAPSSGQSGRVFTSNKDTDIFNKEKRLAKSFGNGIAKNIEDAKTEIQSLVKLNLKCLTRDTQLGKLIWYAFYI
jgi:PHD and RING finger domain-containing protein 1